MRKRPFPNNAGSLSRQIAGNDLAGLDAHTGFMSRAPDTEVTRG